jgi:hypothetical protein
MGVRLDRKARDPQSDFVAQTPEEQTSGDATYRELARCCKIFSASCFRLGFATTLRASHKFDCRIL